MSQEGTGQGGGEDVFVVRSEGISSEGVRDQYADGRAARSWRLLVGDSKERTDNYRTFLVSLLRDHGARTVLDAACGTGIDSMMLLDEGFEVVSIDASDKMLKYALQARWEKRRIPNYDRWVIEEANWVTLAEDIAALDLNGTKGGQFDAVLCLGNSFAHLLDRWGDQREQRQALKNMAAVLRPGGLLLIDHRNYDAIVEKGATPGHSIYYNSKHETKIETSVLFKRGQPELVTFDYCIRDPQTQDSSEFRLAYYPHKLSAFTRMLDEAFGPGAKHTIYADFRPLSEVPEPDYYIHAMTKPDSTPGH